MPFNKESDGLNLVSIRNKEGSWLLNECVFYTQPSTGISIFIKKGLITDLASIPKWARFFISNDDYRVRRAAVAHDDIYRTKGIRPPFYYKLKAYSSRYIGRKQADKLFREALIEDGLDKIRAFLMYYAVRLGGVKTWNR